MKQLPPPSPQSYEYIPPETVTVKAGSETLRRSIRTPMMAGIGVVLLIVVAFGGWAATAPLAGGAVAPGIISPDGSRKTIQHLEGGIIGEIRVRDGDYVTVGTPLLALEDTRARAAYDVLLRQYQSLAAAKARLTAEQRDLDDIDFPEELLAVADDPEVTDILALQRYLFTTRRDALAVRKSVLQQRILQIREKINGAKAQYESAGQRLKFVKQELRAKEFLFKKKLLPMAEVLAVRRASAEVQGDQGSYRYVIAENEQRVGETELELVGLDAVRSDEIATELDRVRGELAKHKEQLAASADMLKRTVIVAPVSGTVVNLQFKTQGGVIQPGEPILDIVPAEDDLLIDARVAPVDIDVVYPGLPAQVHLSAYSQRAMPQIEGKVRSISADSLQDDQSGISYYLARVEVDRQELGRLNMNIQLVPGMPAEVLIVTSERTLFGYLLEPIRDLLRRSLREV
jgi:HlyD family secretion protein/epimerase transport system membrane fusion protein